MGKPLIVYCNVPAFKNGQPISNCYFKLCVCICCIYWLTFTGFISGKSDPFCVVRLGTQEQKTDVCDATLNPKWNKKVRPCL